LGLQAHRPQWGDRPASLKETKILGKHPTTRLIVSTVALMLLAAAGSGARQPTERLRLFDLDGRSVDPLQSGRAKAIVLVFVRTDCPISNRYAPEVRRIHESFSPRGVVFWLVYPDPNESVATIRKHIEVYQYPFPALRDPVHELVKLTGARVTPEAAVFVPDAKGSRMVYRGRIDDRYVEFGKARPEPTIHDLELVLTEILKGHAPPLKTTTAVGCFIADLK